MVILFEHCFCVAVCTGSINISDSDSIFGCECEGLESINVEILVKRTDVQKTEGKEANKTENAKGELRYERSGKSGRRRENMYRV